MALSAPRLLDFSDAMNERWWEHLEAADPELLAHNFELSFRSVLGVLTHIANIEHAWMDVVEGREVDWARTSTKTWSELKPVRAYVEEARQRTRGLVEDLSEKELARPCRVEPPVPGFPRNEMTVEELVFTVFTHEQWHRGELLGAFWSRDVEPPPVDWPRYATPVAHP